MTLRSWLVIPSLVLVTGLLGCTSDVPQDISSTNVPANEASTATQTANSSTDVIVTPTGTDPFPDPGQTVSSFLQAVQAGNQEVASALVTPKAIEETEKLNMVVAPPSTPEATYQVGEVEYHAVAEGAEAKEAHVLSNWSEPTEDGASTSQIVWILKKSPVGWRISGMAVRAEGSEEAMMIDFENAKLLAELMGDSETQPTSQPAGPTSGNQSASLQQPTTPQQPSAQGNQQVGPQNQPPASTATRPGGVQLR